jgi:hypothetical protein
MSKWNFFLSFFLALVALPERPRVEGGGGVVAGESLTLMTGILLRAPPPLCLGKQVDTSYLGT